MQDFFSSVFKTGLPVELDCLSLTKKKKKKHKLTLKYNRGYIIVTVRALKKRPSEFYSLLVTCHTHISLSLPKIRKIKKNYFLNEKLMMETQHNSDRDSIKLAAKKNKNKQTDVTLLLTRVPSCSQ